MHEGAPKPEELKKVRDAYEEADPTTFSPVSPEGELEEVGTANGGNEIMRSGNERYYHVTQNPERQLAVGRMLKGVMNISDVVRVQGSEGSRFYSKEMPLDKIREQTSLNETRADAFILKQVFGDFDHAYTNDMHQNIERHDERAVHYDFGNADLTLADNATYSYGQLEQDTEALSLPEGEVALQKLDILERRFAGSMGKQFVEAIVKNAYVTPEQLFDVRDYRSKEVLERAGTEIFNVEAIQNLLLRRIAMVKQSLENHLPPPLNAEEGEAATV